MRRFWARRPHGDDGSMAMYLVIAVVGLALGSLMVPMIVTSAQVTRSDTSRDHAIDAARAGLNVMLGQIRAAQSDGVGTSTMLPCNPASGRVNGDGSSTDVGIAEYYVSVTYYLDDPVTTPNPTPMRCVQDSGTYLNNNFTPRYARVTSVGTDGKAGSISGRTLSSTYTFKTTNTNIVGGLIRIYPPASGSSTSYCMDAGPSPSAGTVVTLQVCTEPPTNQQIWAYRSDLTLQLVSSASAALPDGLCIDTADPPTRANPVKLSNCATLTSPSSAPYTQQWSFNDNGGFQASNTDSATTGTLSGQCIAAASQNTGITLALANCSEGSTISTTQAWIPNPAVGAGAAKSPQLINYEEFGRCLDVTNKDPNSDHLLDYPCKQNPKPDAVAFNQKFTTPAIPANASNGTGQIYTVLNGTKYCLTTPGSDGGYVRTTPCVDGQANQQWTVYNGSDDLTYSAKYRIIDNGTRCLGLITVVGQPWSWIDVESCSSAVQLKWNASPDLVSSTVSGITEPNSNGG